jgi:carboxypeptidase family protein
MIPRAAVLAMLAACASAPPPEPPLHNVAGAGAPAPQPRGPGCPPSAPVRVRPPPPALGAIAGTVVDERCELLTGATIVVRSQTRLARAEITDESGRFTVLDLTPGEYVIAVYYLDATLERGGVKIRAGAVENVQLAMPPPVRAEPRITHGVPTP